MYEAESCCTCNEKQMAVDHNKGYLHKTQSAICQTPKQHNYEKQMTVDHSKGFLHKKQSAICQTPEQHN
jgi:hypothetical protein